MRKFVGSLPIFPSKEELFSFKAPREFFFRVVRASIVFIIALVLTQDFQILPGILTKSPAFTPQQLSALRAEQFFVTTQDAQRIDVLRLAAPEEKAAGNNHWAGILFHGNAGSNISFLSHQSWLRERGVAAYSFDYRGVGNSSGWPSESGIYKDTDAVWEYVRKRENISPSRLILFGISLGTGPALALAAKTNAAIVILASPYTSLPEVVRSYPWVGLLSPFVRYTFPSSTYIRQLNNTCVIASHAEDDTIIPYRMAGTLTSLYAGQGKVYREFSKTGGHFRVFWDRTEEIAADLKECMEAAPPSHV